VTEPRNTLLPPEESLHVIVRVDLSVHFRRCDRRRGPLRVASPVCLLASAELCREWGEVPGEPEVHDRAGCSFQSEVRAPCQTGAVWPRCKNRSGRPANSRCEIRPELGARPFEVRDPFRTPPSESVRGPVPQR
jgi:hypothetical protein